MKTGKEIKTTKFKNFNVTFGSVNNKNPKAIYVNISAWVSPIDDNTTNFNQVIRSLNKRIRQSLYNSFIYENDCVFDKDRTIVDLDIRESGIRYGKRSFMNCEVTLFLHSEIPVTSEFMKDTLSKLTDMVIKTNFDSNKTFNFYKKKV
jgi:hypothetical protein